MNLNERNRRPVGRGALLERIAANASSSSTSEETRSTISSSTSNESLLDTSKISSPELDSEVDKPADVSTNSKESGYKSNGSQSQGRGQMLQRILHATQSISNDTFNLEAAPKPYGLGRGRIIKMLSEKQTENQVDVSVQSIDDGVESLSVESTEQEPVIKRGTKG